MSEKDSELQNQDIWDIDQAEVRPATHKPRAVVSVAFNRDDFNRVTEAAQRSGVKTSEFIREATLDRAAMLTTVTEFVWGGFSLKFNSVMIQARTPSGTSTRSRLTRELTAYVTSE